MSQPTAHKTPPSPAHVIPLKLDAFKVACSSCNLRELCLPMGLSQPQMAQLDALVATRKSLKRGEVLFHAGDPFRSLYAVRTGFFKTCVSAEDGRDQVTGFQMAGELLGLDGISTDQHACDAIALEDSQVCVIPYADLEELSREFTDLQHQFHKIMSRECDERPVIAGRGGLVMITACYYAGVVSGVGAGSVAGREVEVVEPGWFEQPACGEDHLRLSTVSSLRCATWPSAVARVTRRSFEVRWPVVRFLGFGRDLVVLVLAT